MKWRLLFKFPLPLPLGAKTYFWKKKKNVELANAFKSVMLRKGVWVNLSMCGVMGLRFRRICGF